jgi:hypothetical protein
MSYLNSVLFHYDIFFKITSASSYLFYFNKNFGDSLRLVIVITDQVAYITPIKVIHVQFVAINLKYNVINKNVNPSIKHQIVDKSGC